jgi:thiol-disulfide isomerase/thioredoxin
MTANFRSLLVGLTALAVMLGVLSCSKTETAKLQPPAMYTEQNMNQAMQLIDEGYTLLDSANVGGAVAKFSQIDSLVPKSLASLYHTACVYALTGDKEKAIATLTSMVDKGYDRSDELINATDFESIRADSRFVDLVNRTKKNYETGSAVFAAGMPEYTVPPQVFATEAELTAWTEKEGRLIQMCGRFWGTADYEAARIDFAARRLASIRDLKKTDTTFDYGLERVRASVRMQSPYEPGWGTMTDLIVKEADQFLKSSPAAEKTSEVNYHAGFAFSMKCLTDDSLRLGAYQQAQGYLSKVVDGTPYTGAAKAMLLVNQLHSPNPDETSIGAQIKTLIEQYPSDLNLWRVVATQFNNEAAKYIWPIPINLPDIDGKNVTLADYTGKALMIDFWATWCPPCRAELPNLVAVYNEYHAKGLEVLSISLDRGQEVQMDAFRKWTDSVGMKWRHIYDGNFWNTELVRRFYVGSIPAPFLVGPNGSIVAMGEDLRGDKLAETVRAALGIM